MEEFRVLLQELVAPAVVVEQGCGISAKKMIREIDGLDRRESGGWVIEDLGHSWVRGLTGRQAADGQVRVLLFHPFGESPGAVDDEQPAVTIRFAEQRAADAEPDVTCERFGTVIGVGPEGELVSLAQWLDRAFAAVLAAVDDDDRGGLIGQVGFSPGFRFVERGGYVDGDAAVAIE